MFDGLIMYPVFNVKEGEPFFRADVISDSGLVFLNAAGLLISFHNK